MARNVTAAPAPMMPQLPDISSRLANLQGAVALLTADMERTLFGILADTDTSPFDKWMAVRTCDRETARIHRAAGTICTAYAEFVNGGERS